MPVHEVPRFPWLPVLTGLVFGLVGLGCLALVPGAYADGRSAVGAPVCPGGGDGACLTPAPGRVDDHRSSSRGLSTRHHFQPDDRSVEDGWVRFEHDEVESQRTPEMSRLLRGAPVTGLYWKGEPVAFELDGTRIGTLDHDRDGWTSALWGGLLFLPFGGLGVLSYRRWRPLRDDPAAAPTPPGGDLWGAALVGSMLGAIAAFVPDTVTAQVTTYVVVTGGFVALLAWLRARHSGANGPEDHLPGSALPR